MDRREARFVVHKRNLRIMFAECQGDRLRARRPVLDWSWLPNGRVLYSITEPGPDSETCNHWTVRIDPKTGKSPEKPKRLTNWAGFCADTSSATADSKRLAFRRWAWQGHVDVAELEASGARISNLKRLTQYEGRNYLAHGRPTARPSCSEPIAMGDGRSSSSPRTRR
jgi:hypothetical protein